ERQRHRVFHELDLRHRAPILSLETVVACDLGQAVVGEQAACAELCVEVAPMKAGWNRVRRPRLAGEVAHDHLAFELRTAAHRTVREEHEGLAPERTRAA